jgi:hypothetical protein
MDGWADAIVAAASVAAMFFAVMAFRGLLEGLEGFSGRCDGCHRATLLPPPIDHLCWHCRHHRSAAEPAQRELGI